MKTRFKPRLRSYVWRDRPTEVVIWKVVLPRGIDVKGTLVGDTNPTVYVYISSQISVMYSKGPASCAENAMLTYSERRKYSRAFRPSFDRLDWRADLLSLDQMAILLLRMRHAGPMWAD